MKTRISPHAKLGHLDTAGTVASGLCALHCAAMPMLVTLLPLVGLGALASEPVEWALLSVSALLGIGSLCLGYRVHRSGRAIALLAMALGLLAAGRGIEEHALAPENLGVWLSVLGGVGVAVSHVVNRALCRACRSCA